MVTPGTSDINILQTEIRTRGMLSPGNITSISFDAKNITSTNVSEARLYYTDNNTFSTTNLVGSITTGPTANV